VPRIRSIKPEAFDDPDLGSLPPVHRWIFVGLWTQADREGRVHDEPARLKVRVAPYDDVNMDDVLQSLAPKFITRYSVEGCNYIQINNFEKHQKPHPKEASSVIPRQAGKKHGKPGISGASKVVSGSLILDPGSMMHEPEDGFDAWWALYPNKKGKATAKAKWKTLKPDADLTAAILAATERQKWSAAWLKDEGQFVPHPATWLHQRRWEDTFAPGEMCDEDGRAFVEWFRNTCIYSGVPYVTTGDEYAAAARFVVMEPYQPTREGMASLLITAATDKPRTIQTLVKHHDTIKAKLA
jgi:hypothetical protein